MIRDSIVENIESLPPLSKTVLLTQSLCAKGFSNVNKSKIIKVIETDATLSKKILKILNSSIYGFSEEIISVSQAISLFGVEKIYGLVLKHYIDENIKVDTIIYGVDTTIFNDISHLQNILLIEWYSKIDSRETDYLSFLALIMESGKYIVAQEIAMSNDKQGFMSGYENCDDISVYEDSILGTTSYYISGLLLEHWNLDQQYVDILKYIDYEKDDISQKTINSLNILNIIKTAINTKEILSKKSVLKACKYVKDMGLDADYFLDITLRVKRNYLFCLKNR